MKVRRRGFTILEISVYSTLLAIIMTALYLLLRTTLAFFVETNATSALQASAQKAAVKVTTELAVAHRGNGNIVVGSAPAGVVFLSPRNGNDVMAYDSEGAILWQKWVCYWYDASSGTLRRASIPITPTSTPPACPYTPADFRNVAPQAQVADKMVGFNAVLSGSGTVASFTASFAESVHGTSDYALQVQNQVLLRN